MQKEKIFTGLLILDSMLLIILVISIFLIFRQKENSNQVYQQNLSQLETERASIKRERAAWTAVIEQKNKTIESYRVIDSAIADGINRQTNLLNNLDKRNEKTTAPIGGYGSAELRSAFSAFK
jgi:hypothetical protein